MTNSWHERFSEDDFVYGKEPNAFAAQAAGMILKGKVLCIAEGEGRNAVHFASLGFDVTAWDFAQAGLDKTAKLAVEKGVSVKTELVDLAEADWQPEQWDAVVQIFGHLPPAVMERTLTGIKRALKPNGYYVCELYTKEQLHYKTGGPRDEAMLVNPVHMLNEFEGYFIEHFYTGEVYRQEGKLHTGQAHVAQCLFKKRQN